MSSTGSTNPLQHPLKAAASALGSSGVDPRLEQKLSFFQMHNEGPAETAAKITGVVAGGKRKDDAPYFTNNEGIPWPDAAHSKNVGGIPVLSDTFLLQKQQTFNRSKNLERTGHTPVQDHVPRLTVEQEWSIPRGLVRLDTSSAPKTCPTILR